MPWWQMPGLVDDGSGVRTFTTECFAMWDDCTGGFS